MRDTYSELVRGSIAGANARYTDGTESLRLTVYSGTFGLTITLSGRLLVDDGRIVPFAHILNPGFSRTADVLEFTLPCGFLLSAVARITSGTAYEGQAFGVLSLGYGAGAKFTELEVLASGSITTTHRLSFPGSLIVGPLDNGGRLTSFAGTNPAANTQILETVTTGARWRVLAIQFTLVTDANAANREVSVIFDDGGSQFVRAPAGVSQAASLTYTYCAFTGAVLKPIVSELAILIPMPTLELLGGHRFGTKCMNMQAGDDFSAPIFYIEERTEGA